MPLRGGTPSEIFPEARNQGAPAWSGDGQSIIFGRLPWLESAKTLPVRLEKFDVGTRQLAEVSGAEDMLLPATSPDGRFLAMLHTAAAQISIYEFATDKWTLLDQNTMCRPARTRDSSAFYFITRQGELRRYHHASRKTESLVRIPASETGIGVFGAFLEAFDFLGLGPDGEPLLVHDQRSSQLYAIKRQKW